MVKGKLDDLQGALADCDKAIEIDPTKYFYYLHRAGIKKDLYDGRGTEEDLKKCRELKND